MTIQHHSEQKDLFSPPKVSGTVLRLEVRGMVIPNFKNAKMIIPPSAKKLKRAIDTGSFQLARAELESFLKRRPALITNPEVQEKMSRITESFVSQLRSIILTGDDAMLTGHSKQLRIASLLPADDCWTAMPETAIRAELCESGQEGVVIEIERIR